MARDTSYDWRKQTLWGLMLIGIGILFLLDRFDLLQLQHIWRYWPFLLTLFGINKLIAPISARQVLGGLWLIFLSGWLYVSIERMWGLYFWNSWPLLLIFWGINLVLEPLLNKYFVSYQATDPRR